jgi:hypothetical protein
LETAEDILGYLKKYPAHGYIINPKPPSIDPKYETVKLKEDFGGQYQYFQEDLDPKFPEPLVPEMDINIFVDANHAHDKVTGRSVTGLFCFVSSTPVSWRSKRQASVQTSTFGAEFESGRRRNNFTLIFKVNGYQSGHASTYLPGQYGSGVKCVKPREYTQQEICGSVLPFCTRTCG